MEDTSDGRKETERSGKTVVDLVVGESERDYLWIRRQLHEGGMEVLDDVVGYLDYVPVV